MSNISDVGSVPKFDQFHEGNTSDEGLDQLVTVGFQDDSPVATAIDFSTVEHVQCCGHQVLIASLYPFSIHVFCILSLFDEVLSSISMM